MKDKVICLASLVLCGFFLLSGCTLQQEGEKGSEGEMTPTYEWGTVSDRTITVWGDANDLVRPYMARAFERYTKLTGNIVNAVPLSKKDLENKVPDAFNSDTAEKPDILLSYGGTAVINLNPNENFYDFTEAQWVNDLTDTAINQAIFDGKVIGLPHGEAAISGTLYRKDIFKKLNIEIPKTQEEFMKVCETLLKNGITPMYLPYAETTMLLYQFPMDSILENREVLTGLNDGSLSYENIPEMGKIVDWYKEMADKGYFGKDYVTDDWNGMDEAMQSGKYGMMLCWDTWVYTDYTGDTTKIGIMPAFMGVPENGCFEGANIMLSVVNKNSEQLDAALDLINFMADPYNYNVNYAGLYTAPVFNRQSGSVTTPQYMEAESLIEKLFYDSTAWIRIKGFSQIDAQYIQKYMQGELSQRQCLQEMDLARKKRAGMTSQ